ncbi:MAG: DUF1292 domain-containing protein [Lachnospiraceae bacterium]|nr:DUF1292 domain-containing protein [Lachnospiraceae bacterium]
MSMVYETPEEEMSVEINLDDGRNIECSVVTIFEVDGKDYIALLPMVDEDDELYGEVWYYGYKENLDDPNEEPELIYIEDDETYEAVADAFDEYLDSQEFDEIIED